MELLDLEQAAPDAELAALITSLHRAAQRQLPVALVGAGLPQLRGPMGTAKSYAERMFDFPVIGPLDSEAARTAIVKPAQNEGVEYEKLISKGMIWSPSHGDTGFTVPMFVASRLRA